MLDASAAFELLAGTPIGAAVAGRMVDHVVAAPSFMCVEVASVLRRLTAAGRWSAPSARIALGDLTSLGIVWWAPDVLLERVFELRGALTAYDAAYVALAEELDAPLVTCDRAMVGANGHRATIELAGE